MSDPLKISTPLANDALATESLRAALNAGFLYLFSGPVPASADDALDMATLHTELCKMTVGNDGTTGLTFETGATLGAIQKTIGQNWSGTNTFSGVNSASSTQLCTFFRFISAADADAGRTAASTTKKRIQGTVGTVGTHMELSNATLTAGNVQGLNAFEIRQPRS